MKLSEKIDVNIIILVVTILGTTIPLYVHTDSKMETMRKETSELITSIREEIRDFHYEIRELHEKYLELKYQKERG